MSVRFENAHTGRVVEFTEPEEIAPRDTVYPTPNAKAMAQRDAGRRERLLKAMRTSRRWTSTHKPLTRQTEQQREHERREADRRRIAAELRAEFDQRLETERAKWEREQASEAPAGPDQADSGSQAAVPETAHDRDKGAPQESTPEKEQLGPDPAEVRAWAKAEGFKNVPARGRIPDDIMAAFKTEHPTGA